ncbi:MAG: hypothetical protein JST39_17490 [Bacteroidetes bacterium]|nr:hypothetical protein [Bacteroidota bacterium]
MQRIEPINEALLSPSVRIAFERRVNEFNEPITNMKKVLGHSLVSFSIYMQLYALFDRVQEIAGRRAACLYAYSISLGSASPVCCSFFNRMLAEDGVKFEEAQLNEYEKTLVDFGSIISKFKGHISDYIYDSLASYHNNEEMVVLVAFAGQVIASNIFNTVVETDVDDYLQSYKPVRYAAY